MAIKEIEKRFGTIAVEMGYITIDQLLHALEIQVGDDVAGMKHRIIGKILYDLGHLTLSQIERVVRLMGSYSVSMNTQSDDVGDE